MLFFYFVPDTTRDLRLVVFYDNNSLTPVTICMAAVGLPPHAYKVTSAVVFIILYKLLASLEVQSTTRQTVHNCQTSPEDFQPLWPLL
jgi:hypothetical protein